MIQQEVANFMRQTKGDGYNVVVGTHFQQVRKWLSWYRGNVQDFHYYKVVGLNNTVKNREKKTLNMAKTVCEDMDALEVGEATRVSFNQETANNYLKKVLEYNGFDTKFRQHVELSKALGDALMIQFIVTRYPYIIFG